MKVGEQPPEVLALAERVEVRVLRQVVGVVEPGGDGFVEQFDGPGVVCFGLIAPRCNSSNMSNGEEANTGTRLPPTLPVAVQAGRLAVRRPSDELRRVPRLSRQLLGQDAPARAIGLDDDGTPGLDVGVPTAGQVGAELGVADEGVGRRVVLAAREQGGQPQGHCWAPVRRKSCQETIAAGAKTVRDTCPERVRCRFAPFAARLTPAHHIARRQVMLKRSESMSSRLPPTVACKV